MDNWLINKTLNLPDDLNLIPFDEMRPFDKDFFGNLFDQFFLVRNNHFFNDFLVFLNDDRLISVFDELNSVNLRNTDLNRYFSFNIHNFSAFYDIRNTFLDLNIFSLLDDMRNSHLNLLNSLSSFI